MTNYHGYYWPYQISLLLADISLIPEIYTSSAPCRGLSLLINTIALDKKLNDANDDAAKYKAGFISNALNLSALQIALNNEFTEVLQKTSKLKPYFEEYPNSFGWKWINYFEASVTGFTPELASSGKFPNYLQDLSTLQSVLQVAAVGVHAHVEPQDLKRLSDGIRGVNEVIAKYGSIGSSNELQAVSTGIVDIKSKANAIMVQLAAGSNYYELLAGFARLSTDSIPELQTQLIALKGAMDKRLEEMDLGGLLDKCTSDIMELL